MLLSLLIEGKLNAANAPLVVQCDPHHNQIWELPAVLSSAYKKFSFGYMDLPALTNTSGAGEAAYRAVKINRGTVQ